MPSLLTIFSSLPLNYLPYSMLRIGNTSMKPNHLVDNILQATEILAKRYPGGWKNIRSIHLKTETSMSIPIHISNLSANDVGYVDTTAPQKVRFNEIFHWALHESCRACRPKFASGLNVRLTTIYVQPFVRKLHEYLSQNWTGFKLNWFKSYDACKKRKKHYTNEEFLQNWKNGKRKYILTFFITFEQIIIMTCSVPQNNRLNLSFVKDFYLIGEKMARNGRNTAIYQ